MNYTFRDKTVKPQIRGGSRIFSKGAGAAFQKDFGNFVDLSIGRSN